VFLTVVVRELFLFDFQTITHFVVVCLYRHFFVQKQFEKNLVKKMLCVFLTVSLNYFEH